MEQQGEYNATKYPEVTAGEMLQRWNYADAHRKQYEEPARRYYKQYVGYREALSEEYQGRSNLHIPRTYEEIDTLRARMIKSIFATRPYIDFIPRPSGYVPDGLEPKALIELLEDKAKIAASVVDGQLDNLVPSMYDFVTNLMIYPVSIASVGWRYETRTVKDTIQVEVETTVKSKDAGIEIPTIEYQDQEVENEVIIYDDNDIKTVDFFDFWIDPRATTMDNARNCFHREWLTKEEIEGHLHWIEEVGAGTVYWPDDWDSIAAAGTNLEDGRIDRQAAIGLQAETEQGYWETPSQGYLYEVMHEWTDTKHNIMINRHYVILEGDNPYTKHGKKPFIAASFEPLPGEFYGMSACQLLEHLQAELNTVRNQRVDNVSFILNRMWLIRNGADIDESELISRPGGLIHVDNLEQDVKELDTKLTVGPDSYKEEEILKADMENAIGVPAVVRGASEAAGDQTATEVVTKSSSAGIRFDAKVMLFEALAINRLAYLMDCNNQQFIDNKRLIQVYGPMGAEWRAIDPDHLIGEHNYRPAGSSVDPMANKELRRKQLNDIFALFSQQPSPFVDMYELTRLMLETYDIRNVDSIMKNKEQVQMEIQMQQQMAMQQAMMGQAPQPPGAAQGPQNPSLGSNADLSMANTQAAFLGGAMGGE